MTKVWEYRQHANECRVLAANMPSHEQREQLLSMAETWDRLADERQRSVARDQRTASAELQSRNG